MPVGKEGPMVRRRLLSFSVDDIEELRDGCGRVEVLAWDSSCLLRLARRCGGSSGPAVDILNDCPSKFCCIKMESGKRLNCTVYVFLACLAACDLCAPSTSRVST